MEVIVSKLIITFGWIAALVSLSGVLYHFLDKLFLTQKPANKSEEEEFKKTIEKSLL